MPTSKSNIVKLTLDPDNLPPLTEEERAELGALAAMPDDQIDYSDAPFRPDAAWTRAVNFPHAKKQITLRIDEDVLNFFRNTGSRYQTRINAVLRSYVEAHQRT
ncbi:MAG: BrnA antitoxin family protein [Candidatus Accumulibacter sp.]|jgi:uncharacterized protein (DUF4415 family)|nr:BrnA antitoxin family protein [Accumulibacter sp.]